MMLSSVVLPQPEGPTMQGELAFADGEGEAGQGHHLAPGRASRVRLPGDGDPQRVHGRHAVRRRSRGASTNSSMAMITAMKAKL